MALALTMLKCHAASHHASSRALGHRRRVRTNSQRRLPLRARRGPGRSHEPAREPSCGAGNNDRQPLHHHVGTHRLGVVMTSGGVKLAANPDTVREPDIAFVRQDRISATGVPDGFWPGAPDLAVEIGHQATDYQNSERRSATTSLAAFALSGSWIQSRGPLQRTIPSRLPSHSVWATSSRAATSFPASSVRQAHLRFTH